MSFQYSAAAAARCLADAEGHLSDLVAQYYAATAPAAIRRVLRAAKGQPYAAFITAEAIRESALDTLCEAIADEEMA